MITMQSLSLRGAMAHLRLIIVGVFIFPMQLAVAESLVGSIAFPTSLASVPSLRVYYCGQKVTTDIFGKTIRFTVNKESDGDRMYVLVTTKIRPVSARLGVGDQLLNTIDHLRVPNEQPYKFYALVRDKRVDGSSQWRVERKLKLNESRCIPDDTLILLWRPDCIEKLDVDGVQSFPRVVCKNDLVSRFGSEQQLHDFATEMWMEAINSDLFHAKRVQEKVQLAGNRVLRVVA